MYAQKWLVRARGPLPVPDDIAIVAIDETSLTGFGRFPWRRALIAQMLEQLRETHPKAIALDVLFSEATSNADDSALAAAIAKAGNVVTAAQLARAESGGDVSRIASVASFFVSRIDSTIDAQISSQLKTSSDPAQRARLGGLLGKVAIANAKLAYHRFTELFSGDAWKGLANKGAHPQRLLWASTSTKNPRYRDVRYVEELIGPDTVNTLPPATLEAFKDHGRVTRTIDSPEGLERARQTMRALKAVGIDLGDVTLQLQREGVKSFAESYDQLIHTLEERRRALAHV